MRMAIQQDLVIEPDSVPNDVPIGPIRVDKSLKSFCECELTKLPKARDGMGRVRDVLPCVLCGVPVQLPCLQPGVLRLLGELHVSNDIFPKHSIKLIKPRTIPRSTPL